MSATCFRTLSHLQQQYVESLAAAHRRARSESAGVAEQLLPRRTMSVQEVEGAEFRRVKFRKVKFRIKPCYADHLPRLAELAHG